ncbi:beta-galactosidase [Salinispira pacifica]
MNGINHHERSTGLDHLLFGAAYYPEQWDEQTRAQDVVRMRDARFNCVRMGEFAWARLEPEQDRFDFSLFDEQIELLGAAGIRTMMGTPSAAPPAWLTAAHPELLRVDREGRRMAHGSRQHACYNSPVFRERTAAAVRELASHYRSNTNVVGWQVDNEFFCHFRECYCDSCRSGFRAFLKKRYSSVETLNDAWGTDFWSQRYASFDQIDPPMPSRPTYENPAQVLDFQLFHNDALLRFLKIQVDILRGTNPEWWITHNFVLAGMDYTSMTAELDFAGFDFYPMFDSATDRPSSGAAALDKVRSFSGNFIVPELQSGPAAQGSYRQEEPGPGQMRLFAYQALGRGADGILHFRFRTARAGAEMGWEGLIGHDNRAAARFEEVCREGRELEQLSPLLTGTTLSPEIGILLDYGVTELSHRPVTYGLPSPVECGEIIHRTFYDAGYSVGYVNPVDSFASFKLLVLAAWPVIPPGLLERLSTYVQLGGTLIVTARTGIKDEHGNMLDTTPPGPLAPLAGIRVTSATRISDDQSEQNEFVLAPGDEAVRARTPASMIPRVRASRWLECLEPIPGADRLEESGEVDLLGRWTEPPMEGLPAFTLNRVGMGRVIYLGTFPDGRNLRPLLFPLAGEASLVPLVPSLTRGIEVSVRSNSEASYYFVLNHTPKELSQRGLPAGEIIVGPPPERRTSLGNGTLELVLDGYDVAVIRVERRGEGGPP